MASTNHVGKVWTIHTLTSKWLECDCPLVAQAIVCKHVMKVFKMFHLNNGDGSIVREISNLHGGAHGGVILEHNSPNYGIGDNDTKGDDPINKQLGQQNGLEFKDHLESTIDEDVIDVMTRSFFTLKPQSWNFQSCKCIYI